MGDAFSLGVVVGAGICFALLYIKPRLRRRVSYLRASNGGAPLPCLSCGRSFALDVAGADRISRLAVLTGYHVDACYREREEGVNWYVIARVYKKPNGVEMFLGHTLDEALTAAEDEAARNGLIPSMPELRVIAGGRS